MTDEDGMKDKISMALKDPILQMGFEVICSKLSRLEKENVEMKKQLTKAKELLTRFIMSSVYFNGKETDLVEEAEQFLRELEE